MNYVDEEVRVQRLVDGEMNLEERREFFEDLDSSPDEWRRVSLAFVEDQIWRTEYQSLYSQTQPTTAVEVSTTRSGDLSFRHVIFLIAASVVASTTAGYWMGERSSRLDGIGTAFDSDSGPDAIDDDRNPAEFVRDDGDSKSSTDNQAPATNNTYRLQFVRNANGQREVFEIPVFEASEPWMESEQPRLPDNFRDWLSTSGYDVEQNTRYVSGRLDDGRHVVLPVNRVDVKYRGQ